jgi:hypothetical protein
MDTHFVAMEWERGLRGSSRLGADTVRVAALLQDHHAYVIIAIASESQFFLAAEERAVVFQPRARRRRTAKPVAPAITTIAIDDGSGISPPVLNVKLSIPPELQPLIGVPTYLNSIVLTF